MGRVNKLLVERSLKKLCKGVDCQRCPFLSFDMDFTTSWCDIKEALDKIPEDPNQGYWKPIIDEVTIVKQVRVSKCSQCNGSIVQDSKDYNFCPLCGADMRDSNAKDRKDTDIRI